MRSDATYRDATFLTAKWEDLIFISYRVDREMLEPLLPSGLELDLFNGQALVSFTCFRFNQIKFKGFGIPVFNSFAQMHLRFYVKVKGGQTRGVVFYQEYCPYRLVGAVANWLYNESFSKLPLYYIRFSPQYHSYQVHKESGLLLQVGEECCTEESRFIIERYHGFCRQRNGKTLHYQVERPPWNVYAGEILGASLAPNYYFGDRFSEVLRAKPSSVLYSPGSSVTLSRGVTM